MKFGTDPLKRKKRFGLGFAPLPINFTQIKEAELLEAKRKPRFNSIGDPPSLGQSDNGDIDLLFGLDGGEEEDDFTDEEIDLLLGFGDSGGSSSGGGSSSSGGGSKQAAQQSESPGFWEGLGGFLGAAVVPVTNLLVGATAGLKQTPTQRTNPASLNSQQLAALIQQNPQLLRTVSRTSYGLAAQSANRPLSTQERILLSRILRSRKSLPDSFKRQMDLEGRKALGEAGASGGLLKRIGNFFFGADRELQTKRTFTTEQLIKWGLVGLGGVLILKSLRII